MKITVLYAHMIGNDYGLNSIESMTVQALDELGMEIKEYHLHNEIIPCFDGIDSDSVGKIMADIKTSSGVVFSFSVNACAPCSLLSTFFEYFELPSYKDILAKHCFVIAASKNGGEKVALDFVSGIINGQGGDCKVLGINNRYLELMQTDDSYLLTIEKMIEDYYRCLRQERKIFVPAYLGTQAIQSKRRSGSTAKRAADKELPQTNMDTASGLSDTMKPVDGDLQQFEIIPKLDPQQEDEIAELARLFANKHMNMPEADHTDNGTNRNTAVSKERNDIKQLTRGLPNAFKQELSVGMNADIQFIISGQDGFDAYISISDRKAVYSDGKHPDPDLTITADDGVWLDILKHKNTAQKSFLTGKLKVRGNFQLLSKFDMLFS